MSGGDYASSLTVYEDHDYDFEGLVPQISSYDHERFHRRLSQKRLVGTTQWFLDHPHFKAWFVEKSNSSLWCSGKIGSGKTMIALVYPGKPHFEMIT